MQISVFQDIFSCNQVTLSSLNCYTMDPWQKLPFSKHPEIRIQTLFSVFIISNYRLSPRLGVVVCKLVYFKISLVATK